MAFNSEERIRIWNRYYPGSLSAIDVFGRHMTFENFQADHIWPESLNGRSVIQNGIPLAPLSNQEKNDNTNGYVNNKRFVVYKTTMDRVGKLEVDGTIVSKDVTIG